MGRHISVIIEEFEDNTDFIDEIVRSYNAEVGHLDKQDGYNCEKCHNKGQVAVAYTNYVGAKDYKTVWCECRRVRNTLKRAKNSGLDGVIREFTFENFTANEPWQKDIKSKAMRFCKDDEAKWFYIGGQVGCGKTHICTSICAYYIKQGYSTLYMLWAEEGKRLKALASDRDYQQAIKKFKDVDVLYIDDFLKTKQGEEPTTADINLAFEIINHRMLDSSKITIISSERCLDELIDYDEATMSRIYQKAGEYKTNIAKDRNKNMRLKNG